ncbi:MAG TPA: VOC family protein [Acidimicrobiales bacterium]|jgi:catechol 2,3-dioxygenase-like lactoylglutathione lyase family enzyme
MPFTIGKNFHIIHMTDNLKELDAWYYDIFSCQRFMPDSYMPAEVRDASLVLIGNLCVEPLAPSFHVEGWDSMPLGRFQKRFGKRWHSLAWYVPDGFGDLYRGVVKAGVRTYGTGGVKQEADEPVGAVFTHPRDTYTQIEFVPGRRPDQPQARPSMSDPRFRPGWSPDWWARHHPLHLLNFSHATLTVGDVDKARDRYVELFDGRLLHEGEDDLSGTRSAFVAVGEDMVVELAQPLDPSLPIGVDHERNHDSLYSATFKVADLAAAEEYLRRKGVDFTHGDGTTLFTDPATTQGVVMGFTTWSIPGDPRPDWLDEA